MINKVQERLHDEATESAMENADDVEMKALCIGWSGVGYGVEDEAILDEFVVVSHGTEPDANYNPYLSDQNEEEASYEISQEVLRRKQVLNDLYPFKLDGNGVVYEGSGFGLYEFFLVITACKNVTKDEGAQIPRTFEFLVKEIAVSWMGDGAEGWQTGCPGRHTFSGLPPHIVDLWVQISESIGEWFPVRSRHSENGKGDGGIDFFVRKGFEDSRTNAHYLAGQCYVGGNLRNQKSQDIDLNWWLRTACSPSSMTGATKVLAVPFCYPAFTDRVVERLCSDSLVFDRLRLVLIGTEVWSRLTECDSRFKTIFLYAFEQCKVPEAEVDE